MDDDKNAGPFRAWRLNDASVARIDPEDWTCHEPTIRRLHGHKAMTLNTLMKYMEETHDFRPSLESLPIILRALTFRSKSQWVRKLKVWGLRKYKIGSNNVQQAPVDITNNGEAESTGTPRENNTNGDAGAGEIQSRGTGPPTFVIVEATELNDVTQETPRLPPESRIGSFQDRHDFVDNVEAWSVPGDGQHEEEQETLADANTDVVEIEGQSDGWQGPPLAPSLCSSDFSDFRRIGPQLVRTSASLDGDTSSSTTTRTGLQRSSSGVGERRSRQSLNNQYYVWDWNSKRPIKVINEVPDRIPEEKPRRYKCTRIVNGQGCDKTFRRPEHQRRHEKTHNPRTHWERESLVL